MSSGSRCTCGSWPTRRSLRRHRRVHLTNTITTHRPSAIGETVEVTVHPENLRPHAKGRTVDFVTEVTSAGELVWQGRSTYLRRGPRGQGPPAPSARSSTRSRPPA